MFELRRRHGFRLSIAVSSLACSALPDSVRRLESLALRPSCRAQRGIKPILTPIESQADRTTRVQRLAIRIACTVLVALPSTIWGQIIPGPEFQVNTYTANGQSLPAVAADGNGNFVVVWQSSGQD